MFQSNGTLLCGTHRGSIYTIRTPLSNATTVNIFHYLAHSAKITQVRQTLGVRSDRFISSQIVVAFHEAMIISCCEDGILMLWGTQIKSSIQGEDWTPVVLHNKARFLSLVSGVSTGIGRSSTLSSSSLTRFNGFKSKRKRSSGSKSFIYTRWRPATWRTCNGERPCRTTNGVITRIKSNGSCSRRTRSDGVSKESTPI